MENLLKIMALLSAPIASIASIGTNADHHTKSPVYVSELKLEPIPNWLSALG